MKLFVSSLVTLCALALFNNYTNAAPPIVPAFEYGTLYLVGYSRQLNHSKWQCVSSSYLYQNKTTKWVHRNLRLNYHNGTMWLPWMLEFSIRNESYDLILRVNMTEELKNLSAKNRYVIRHYDWSSVLLSEEIDSIHNPPPCTLWTTSYDGSTLSKYIKNFFSALCPQPTYASFYPESGCF
uniref:Lipocalin n=1 Tax=Rhipicephalus zambeziensis TaxID=60191 RepID=A0A224YH49_9ACAR